MEYQSREAHTLPPAKHGVWATGKARAGATADPIASIATAARASRAAARSAGAPTAETAE